MQAELSLVLRSSARAPNGPFYGILRVYILAPEVVNGTQVVLHINGNGVTQELGVRRS